MQSQRLEILRADWQRSQDRIIALSRLVTGRDHTLVTVMIAREVQTRRMLKDEIVRLMAKETQS